MSIFRREGAEPTNPAPQPSRPQAPVPSKNQATFIAAGTKVIGEVSGATDLLVEGELEGRVDLGATLTVGREGRVQGQIQARVVRVEGRVQGNVRGQERVEVTPSGNLEGDISAARVVIAEGAFFKGNVEMGGSKEPESTKAQPAKPQGPSQGRLVKDTGTP